MTVATTVLRNTYPGNGVTSSFPFTFKIAADADLRVFKTLLSSGAQTDLVLTTDYTVTGAGDETGGAVALVAGALSALYSLTLLRDLDLTQETDLSNQGPSFPEVMESALDKAAMISQQIKEQVDRAFKTSSSEAGSALEIPIASVRASKILGFDASGGVEVVTVVPTSGVVATPFAETLLDDTTAAAARTTLGIDGASGVIASGDIAALSITAAKIGALAVTTAKIDALAVTTAKIDASAVTLAKLAADALAFLVPTGMLTPFAGSAAPTGWLLCNGDAVSRTTYAALFAVIGTAFGSGNGSTTFHLPNTKGRFLRGISDYASANGSGSASSSNGTFTAHPYKQTGVRVRLSSGTLTGLSASTNYWLIYVDANTLAFATTLANAIAGTKIAISGANSAVIIQYEDPDASTRVSSTNGAASGAALGSLQTEQTLAHAHDLPYEVATNGGVGGNQYGAGLGAFSSSFVGGNETRPYNLGVNHIIKT